MKHKTVALLPALLILSACASLPFGKGGGQAMEPVGVIEPRPQTRPAVGPTSGGVAVPPVGAKSAAALDTTTAAQKAAALAAPAKPAGEQSLGKTAVALGNVTEPGFWLRSALVKSAGSGRVVTAAGGSIAVDLVPGDGAAQLSLAAFRALNLSLTDLPDVTIFAQ